MKTAVLIAVFSFSLILTQASAAPPKAVYPDVAPVCSCESLTRLSLPNTTIDSAAIAPDGSCRVTATVTHPPTGDRVRVFIGLPAKGWNGREQVDPKGKVVARRPLFPYPQVAKYKGNGSPDDAGNFERVRSPAPATGMKGERSADERPERACCPR